jgi:uridine phosphorylase
MRIIPESEFIINPDGSAFHLHIKPEQLADKIVMMGDPDRVGMTGKFFDSIECDIKRDSTPSRDVQGQTHHALSHGIGTDNIDIVFTELDALANIDFNTRCVKDNFRQLTVVRVGTSGGMQPYCPVGSFVVSEKSIGFDGLSTIMPALKRCAKWISKKNFKNRLTGLLFIAHLMW